MMTAYMDAQGMFTPHTNNCVAATEAFVPLFTGASVGFCMDINPQPLFMRWYAAIDYCLSQGKRLPEPNEMQFACNNNLTLGLGLLSLGSEWASNMPIAFEFTGAFGTPQAGLVVPVMPTGSACQGSAFGFISTTAVGGSSGTNRFRCVR
jgi:hypothetical protein